ncbi:MAG: GAF domain-containing protein [Prolixibacteraceae bacterium]|nr:GAF domain-containing protein [Prolixibacteraceae bacterium]
MKELEKKVLQNKISFLEQENRNLLKVIEKNTEKTFLKEAYEELQELLKAHEKKENEISELLKATQTVLETRDFQKTAKLIFDSCARTIGAKAGYVALLSDDGQENELLFLEDGGMSCTVNPNLPMPIRGLREESYRTGKVVYNNDFMKSEWVKFMPAGHMALRNVLFSPMNIDGKTVGIIGLACKPVDFDENDARIAAAFGDYAAIALKNSKTLEELEKANETKDKFFSIIAHDLRSPINPLLGFAGLLIEDLDKGDIGSSKNYAALINTSLNHYYDFLSELLEWARIQSGKIDFNPEKINVSKKIDDIFDFLNHVALAKEISLTKVVDVEDKVLADDKMLDTILRNLIVNAVKFTNRGGKVHVEVVKDDMGKIKFRVIDTGIGIKDKDISKLFKIDIGFSTNGTDHEKGTGLGLHLCKEFVELHGGEIGVEPNPEGGSAFWFTI